MQFDDVEFPLIQPYTTSASRASCQRTEAMKLTLDPLTRESVYRMCGSLEASTRNKQVLDTVAERENIEPLIIENVINIKPKVSYSPNRI